MDSPRQRDAYIWFTTELANLRAAFRWAADHGDLDVAAAIAACAAFVGCLVENYEPIGWAEELIEPARVVGHPRLGTLYAMASQCYMTGRIDDAVRYSEAGQTVISSSREEVLYEGWLGGAYVAVGEPERTVALCRRLLALHRDTHTYKRSTMVLALALTGSNEDAMAAAECLLEEAEATGNPHVLSFLLFAYGYAMRNADPTRALEVLRRGLLIAQGSGNRANQTNLTVCISPLEAQHGDPLAALEYVTLAIRSYYDSGNTTFVANSLDCLVVLLDRLGRYQPAATIAGFALNPFTAAVYPEFSIAIGHVRDVLGHQDYELHAQKGKTMTTAAMVTYAYDQIDQARTELNAVSE